MHAKIVKIVEYDPVKGRGKFRYRGEDFTFGYRQLKDQKMIPPGSNAVQTSDGTLHPASLKHRLKGFRGRHFKWQS